MANTTERLEYRISLSKLRPLLVLRKALKAAGYPLANPDELNEPDSSIRTKEGYRLVMATNDKRTQERIYVLERYTPKEIVPNDL